MVSLEPWIRQLLTAGEPWTASQGKLLPSAQPSERGECLTAKSPSPSVKG